MTDTLLSTCAGAGATLVAIIGGLLITRNISLESDFRSARRRQVEATLLLERANDSLAVAENRYNVCEIETALKGQEVYQRVRLPSFDLAVVKRVAGLARFNDEEVGEIVFSWNSESRVAAEFLTAETVRFDEEWETFRGAHDLPIKIEQVWVLEFDLARRHAPRPRSIKAEIPSSRLMELKPDLALLRRSTEETRLLVQERFAQNQMADREAKATPRARSLILGFLVLLFCTSTTVVIPLLYLTRGHHPGHLSPQDIVTIFIVGVVVLFGYMLLNIMQTLRD